jgi:hypothetical protein
MESRALEKDKGTGAKEKVRVMGEKQGGRCT